MNNKSRKVSGIYEIVTEKKISFSVYYEDTDVTGVVYHASYIKYFQKVREEILGINYLKKLFKRGIMFDVTHIDIQFLSPARYADTIDVITTMSCKRNVAYIFHHKAVKENDSQSAALLLAVLCGSICFFATSMFHGAFYDDKIRHLLMFFWGIGLSGVWMRKPVSGT